MPTKKEVEDQNSKLKTLLRAADSKLKELAGKLDDKVINNKLGVGAYYDKDKKVWNLVKISYNSDTSTGEVTEIVSVGRDYSMLEYRIREFLAEKILLPTQRGEV